MNFLNEFPKNLISHFPPGWTPRPQQVEALAKIEAQFSRGRKVVVLELPTGGGKSWITHSAVRAIRAEGGRSHILTAQKILQDQYEKDFSTDLMILKGRNAYPCNHPEATPNTKCDRGVCLTTHRRAIVNECVKQGVNPHDVVSLKADPDDTSCPYWKALLQAHEHSSTVFNFSSFLFQQKHGRFGQRDLMVIDEAHNIESQLMGFVELSMWESDLEVIKARFDDKLASGEDVMAWIESNEIVEKVKLRLEELGEFKDAKRMVRSILDEATAAALQESELLEKIQFKIEMFVDTFPKAEWVVEINTKERYHQLDRRLVCRPLHARNYANDLLFSKADWILCASATILDQKVWAENLGLSVTDIGFIKMGSDFPVEHRQIKLEYAGSMKRENKQETLPKLISWIKGTLLPRHQNERGIIHTHSHDIARAIANGVGEGRLLLHTDGMDKQELLKIHASRPDSVLVAPGLHEGVDLKDDLSRFAVICKVPYPNLGDAVVKQRSKMDFHWFSHQTCLKLVQSYGRSVRSKDDWAVTYITDSDFETFYTRNQQKLPEWFKEAIVREKVTA